MKGWQRNHAKTFLEKRCHSRGRCNEDEGRQCGGVSVRKWMQKPLHPIPSASHNQHNTNTTLLVHLLAKPCHPVWVPPLSLSTPSLTPPLVRCKQMPLWKMLMFWAVNHRKTIGTLLETIRSFSNHFYCIFVEIMGLKAPVNYSASIWYDKISICLCESPKTPHF